MIVVGREAVPLCALAVALLVALLNLRAIVSPENSVHPRRNHTCALPLAKINSEFRINDIRGCVTCYMDDIKTSRRFGEGHPKPGRLLAARSFAGSRSDK